VTVRVACPTQGQAGARRLGNRDVPPRKPLARLSSLGQFLDAEISLNIFLGSEIPDLILDIVRNGQAFRTKLNADRRLTFPD
jgi:hypothetical protein